jgi:hypothetical protein
MAYFDEHAAIFGPLFDEVEKLNPQNVYVEDGYGNISVTGDRHALNAAFAILRRHGYQTDERPEKGKSQYTAFFRKEKAPTIYFNFSSTQCRRIKTGSRERTITEDIYETVCDEMEFPEVKQTQEVADELHF